jgi:hypothetical protein
LAKPDSTLPYLSPQRIRRFWAKVNRRSEDECWPWCGSVNVKNGYGYWELLIDGKAKMLRVNRVAYFLHYGVDPVGFLVRHKCDNRPCCNPAHLILGTHQDNMDDMRERRRAAAGDNNGSRLHPERLKRGLDHPGTLHPEHLPRGEGHGMSKLTEDAVRDILANYVPGKPGPNSKANARELAAKHGVDRSLVYLVYRRKIWKHIQLDDVQLGG